jgi:hypothetical protein
MTRLRSPAVAVFSALALALLAPIACGSSSTPPLFTGDGEGDGGPPNLIGGSSSGSLLGGSSGGASSGGVGGGCSGAAQLVYVLSEENDIYSFDPPAKTFTKIGTLNCTAPGMQPNSMAVSRDAVAWVNYAAPDNSTGAVFQVSTSNAACQASSIPLEAGWTRIGMGFSTDSDAGTSETLFIAGVSATQGLPSATPSRGLGSLGTTTQVVTPIGPFSGTLQGEDAELTGTGDGRLYGFFTTTPVQIAEIDKSTGATSNVVSLPTVEVPEAWAFSFWGGDFYLYTYPGEATAGRTTNVTHFSPSTGATDTAYMTNIGFIIVGAGVSTCAPTVSPLQ